MCSAGGAAATAVNPNPIDIASQFRVASWRSTPSATRAAAGDEDGAGDGWVVSLADVVEADEERVEIHRGICGARVRADARDELHGLRTELVVDAITAVGQDHLRGPFDVATCAFAGARLRRRGVSTVEVEPEVGPSLRRSATLGIVQAEPARREREPARRPRYV